MARSHALKSLQAGRFPQIRFHADDLQRSGDGSRVTGSLEIHGRTRAHVVDLHTEDVGDRWRLSCDAVVLQSDFGIKLYSMLLGRDEGRRRGDGVRHRAPAKRT